MTTRTTTEDVSEHANLSEGIAGMGMSFVRRLGRSDPFSSVKWVMRKASIKDDHGKVIFEQDVEAPESWSQRAVDIVSQKYLNGELGSKERESSIRDLVYRVVSTIGKWGHDHRYFSDDDSYGAFCDDLAYILINQMAAFNSPVWFNVGVESERCEGYCWDDTYEHTGMGGEVRRVEDGEHRPQGSACFIQSVEDDMESIMDLAKSEAMLFKRGSGTGTDLSPLRSSKEKLSGGGKPSGPVSFLKVYDRVASIIKSGGKCLVYDQPVYTAKGPKKAWELAKSGGVFEVLSYSKRLKRVAAKQARAWFSGVKECVEVVTDKGTFRVSHDHPFMLKTGQAVRAGNLKAGLSLMPVSTSRHSAGYIQVGLQDGRKGKGLLHRMIASDVLGWDVVGKVVHHDNEDILDCDPGNLRLYEDQAGHARHHGTKNGAFYTEGCAGTRNGMHKDSRFWMDESKSSKYRADKSAELNDRGNAVAMQKASRRQAMLNMGYELINAGYDISTFDDYCQARYVDGRRVPHKGKQVEYFAKHFGDYDGFLSALRSENHRVVSVRLIGMMDVVSVEVFDDEPDDKRDWSEHNYTLAPFGCDSPFMSGVVCLNTRRAARMQTLLCDHPDIIEFIRCKPIEERKAKALIAAGYDGSWTGDVYDTVAYQNTNLSVRATDSFMVRADSSWEDGIRDDNWPTTPVTGGPKIDSGFTASEILDEIAKGTHECGDPGMQFTDTINRWHTCPNSGRINSSNPCSEFVYLDDTACNLASINLMKFRRNDGTFDIERFRTTVRVLITAMDILVDLSSYPTAKIAENSHRFRPLGLGYANLGAYLMASGLPYDSDEGRDLAAAITALMHGEAYLTSGDLARNVGPFAGFAENQEPMLKVLGMHYSACGDLVMGCHGESLRIANVAHRSLDTARACGANYGYRNSQVTVLAPTGTIAFMMDCDTTGIEPSIALVSYKTLAGGGMIKMVSTTVRQALETLGYDDRFDDSVGMESEITTIVKAIESGSSLKGLIKDEHLPVFATAIGDDPISWEGHVKMMAAVQPFLSGAISKTVNMPREATVEDIRNAYVMAWKLGVKALAIFRDGSKGDQPVKTTSGKDELPTNDIADTTPAMSVPVRSRLPRVRDAKITKFNIGGREGYMIVGQYEDGSPGELFVTMSGTDATTRGLMDVVGKLVSLGIQYNIPVSVLASKLEEDEYEPKGATFGDPDVPIAKSLTNYVGRKLRIMANGEKPVRDVSSSVVVVSPSAGSLMCPECGSPAYRRDPCEICPDCGLSGGCG